MQIIECFQLRKPHYSQSQRAPISRRIPAEEGSSQSIWFLYNRFGLGDRVFLAPIFWLSLTNDQWIIRLVSEEVRILKVPQPDLFC